MLVPPTGGAPPQVPGPPEGGARDAETAAETATAAAPAAPDGGDARAGRWRRVWRRRRVAVVLPVVLALVAATVAVLYPRHDERDAPPAALRPPAVAPTTPQVSSDPGARIWPVAGTGGPGVPVSGALALQTSLGDPFGIAVDAFGNLYYADFGSNRVMRISAQGVITTVAGNGTAGFSGDGGPATAARLNQPAGIALGHDGDLYIADTFNHRIRRVDRDGIISTFAGTDEHIVVGTAIGYRDAGAGDGGPATEAPLSYPGSVALDAAGNAYIADFGENLVRRVDTRGIITTYAGSPGVGSFGDGGPATAALLDHPYCVAVDAAGNLYIDDSNNSRIRKVDTRGVITTFAGDGRRGFAGDGGPATRASLQVPRGVAVDAAGNVYITDRGNGRIRKVDPRGVITTLAGSARTTYSGDGGPAGAAGLGRPDGAVAVDHQGLVFLSERISKRIRVVAPSRPPARG
ncbi:Putative ascorbate-dependent monooxygenase (fragment) [Frankia canadensis]|uniref:Ascorbate-dependent monooxygenase n=1 Tax=Frankia canadensis TaxID=1836972 RepID=A0A2I2KV86_9ACTN